MKKIITTLAMLFFALGIVQAQENLALTFENAEIVTEGMTDFYEVDVVATRTSATDFKVGDGQFYIDYNPAAFGTEIGDATVDFEYPVGSILAEQAFIFDIYAAPIINNNTNGTVSIAWSQFFSASSIAANNITDTPTVLGHLKIEMINTAESPDICFNVTGTNFDDQFFTACGPFTGGPAPVDCSGMNVGMQILDYNGSDCSGAVIACPGGETQWDGMAWNNGTPDSTMSAVINGAYTTTANGNLDVCELTITAAGNLTVNADNSALVQNDITNDGTLLVEHTGSVVQVSDMASVTNNGTMDVVVNTPTLNTADFMILGSPMAGETREDVWANAFNVQDYTTSAFVPNTAVGLSGVVYNFSSENLDDWNAYTTGALNAGEGFLVFPQTSLTAPGGVFTYNYNTGTLNNGVITRPLVFNTTAANSPNMLSNPYPSGIDAAAFLAANPQIDAAYFWDHLSAPSPTEPGPYTNNYDMDDISVINSMGPVAAANGGVAPTGVIATAQGFGVFASAAGTATFNNSMRVTTGNTTLRAADENRDRLWLNVRSEAYGVGSNALVGFTSNATEGYDAAYDSARLATIISLHSNIGDDLENGYVIQGREAFNVDMQIPFSFETTVDENTAYRISLSDFDGNAWSTVAVYLVDNTTGVIRNLSENDYVFTSEMGTFNGRFTLQFRDKSLAVTDVNLSEIVLYPNPANSIVNIASPRALVSGVVIRDIRNREIENLAIDNLNNYALDLSKLGSGVYFVTVATDAGSITKRVIKE